MGVDCGHFQTSKEVVVSNKIKRPAGTLEIYLSDLIRTCHCFKTYPPQRSSNLTEKLHLGLIGSLPLPTYPATPVVLWLGPAARIHSRPWPARPLAQQ